MYSRSPRIILFVSLAAFALAGLWWAGCSHSKPPISRELSPVSERTPVVFVPGVTGVGLRDRATGKVVWGKGGNLLRPHDRGHGTARPVVAQRGGPDLLPDGVIRELRMFGIVRVGIYQELIDLFEANGYQHGDLEDPEPEDDFFLFAYDWRQDNVDSARLLADRLEQLRRRRGEPSLEVTLICQSNGAHVCRYFAKYGALGLVEAEAGGIREPTTVRVDKLALVGASNGGSIRVLRELNRGRKYVQVVGRYWAPETLFTFLSLYQDLPVYTDDLFVDSRGQPMKVDLFAAESWRHFGWSIYHPRIRKRVSQTGLPAFFGGEAEREALLRQALARARRFHQLLHRDVPSFGATRYYLVQNTGQETSARAVLAQNDGQWQTLFTDDRQVRRRPALLAAVTAAGDGHATTESQNWLSPQERDRIRWDPLDVDGSHRRVILHPEVHQHLLEIVADDGATES